MTTEVQGRSRGRNREDTSPSGAPSATALVEFDPRRAAADIRALVDKRSDQLLSLFQGDERMVERFKTVALHAVTSNPKLLRADPATIIEAIRDSATLGLEPNGVQGQGWILPYWNKSKGAYDARFQPGWRGLLGLVDRRHVATLEAQVVFENDQFSLTLGSSPDVQHVPALSARGKRIGTYSVAVYRDGSRSVEWMSHEDIELVRLSSRAADDGPWTQWYDEMARKTVLRRHMKRLPLTPLGEHALALDSVAEEMGSPEPRSAGAQLRGVAKVHARLGMGAPEEVLSEIAETPPAEAEGSAEAPPASTPGDVSDLMEGLDADLGPDAPAGAGDAVEAIRG